MEKCIKVQQLSETMLINLEALNKVTTIKVIIDYLVDKLTAGRKEEAEAWKKAAEYAKIIYPELDGTKHNIRINWAELTIEIYEK